MIKTLPSKISGVLSDEKISKFITNLIVSDEIPPSFTHFPESIDKSLVDVYKKQGIEKLYSHQTKAYEYLQNGKNIVVTTPTASGKSLCYNLYVVDKILKAKKNKKQEKAIYIFPTKALSEDQKVGVLKLSKELNNKFNVYKYDGDTPQSIRQAIKVKGDIILTNPDMLHTGILPNHTKWVKFFLNLKYVVIDEVHIYKGVFGSHFALVIERLKRIARFYNTNLQFILLSATISNAKEHAESIIGDHVELIEKSGAPKYKKNYVFYNPPFIKEANVRRGLVLETIKIAKKMVKEDLQVINFMPSRLYVELVYSQLVKKNEEYKNKIVSYRGGYLPNERREIEKKLKNKEVNFVVSTNALELGIDIGTFEVAILAGFPGSISAFFQRAGRAGRKGESIVFFIASNSPIDQYLVTNPEYFFMNNPESAFINPYNVFIFMSHLKCSLFEIPFSKGEKFYRINVDNFLEKFVNNKVAAFNNGKYYYSDTSYPAENISLRTATNEIFVIVNTTYGKNEIVGYMDRYSAFTMLYPHAIYLHRGNIYTVKKLDLKTSKAYINETSANYYTDSLVKTDIKVLAQKETKEKDKIFMQIADVLVRSTVTKFKKLKFFTNENIGWGDVNLPPIEMHSEALFVGFYIDKLDNSKFIQIELDNSENQNSKEKATFSDYLAEIISSISYMSKSILPLFLYCDRGDIGVADTLKSEYYEMPGFFIYDKIPGGINLAKEASNFFPDIFRDFVNRIKSCSCKNGCPSCIGTGYQVINKKDVLNFLSNFID